MTRTDDYDYDDILQDGESVRVPMMLLDADSVQRAVATSQVTDAFALHKPGFRDARTLLGARASGRTPNLRRQHKREEEAAADARATAYEERGTYLADAWKTPFRDAKLMQQGYHPAIAIGYGTGRDVRGPEAEAGIPDSEAAYQASKTAASNAWRITPLIPTPFTPNYQRFDPQPGAGGDNPQRITEAQARVRKELAEARDVKERRVGVAREDYIRRTRTAWDPTAATGIEAQREKWLGK